MCATPLHPGRPRSLTVKGDGIYQSLSGTYDLDLSQLKSPVWRSRDSENGEIFREGTAPFFTWVLVSSFEHQIRFTSSDPSGTWEDGLVVSAIIASPSIIASLAFPFPHKSYEVYLTGGAGKVDIAEGRASASLLARGDLIFLHTENGEQIPAIHRQVAGARFSLLYSHGNSEDLGSLFPYFDFLADCLGVNVLAYDYVGYSLSHLEGHAPSEEGCYRAVQAAWTYLSEVVPEETIVLYGRSIGSGPTVELACRQCATSCAGIILESPIASGARAAAGSLMGNYAASSFGILARHADIFVNCDKVGKITRPITIMHGLADRIVPVSNGQELFEGCRECWRSRLWIEGCGHNDMPKDVCFNHIRLFLTTLSVELDNRLQKEVDDNALQTETSGNNAQTNISAFEVSDRRLSEEISRRLQETTKDCTVM